MRFVQAEAVADLKPWVGNPRIHGLEDVEAIRRSMERYGWTNPVLAQEGTGRVIAGHGRLQAAAQLGRETVPVLYLDIDDQHADEYTVADNQIPTLSELDEAKLGELLGQWADDKPLLGALGFSDEELAEVISGKDDGEVEEDGDLPELPEDPIPVPGEIWVLGDHRLLCGDSTDPEQIARVVGAREPQMVWSDPPYGLGGYAGRSGKFDAVHGDDEVPARLREFFGVGEAAEVYVCCEFKTYGHLVAARGIPRSLIVWVKQSFGMGRGYRRQYEFVGYWGDFNSTDHSDVWHVGRDAHAEYLHPTQKPVELSALAMRNSSKRGDLILDPFCGSGSVIMAGEQLGRHVAAVELDPAFVEVAIRRWERFTEGKAVLDGTDLTLDLVKKEREMHG